MDVVRQLPFLFQLIRLLLYKIRYISDNLQGANT